jgi:hypothetical protein
VEQIPDDGLIRRHWKGMRVAAALCTSMVLGASSAVDAVAVMRCKRGAGDDASCTGQRRDDAAVRRGTAAAPRADRAHDEDLATGLATVVKATVATILLTSLFLC